MAAQLGKLAIGVLVEGGAKLRGLGGEALHGLLFRVLKQYSPELASKIHNPKEQRPFSLSPPLGDGEFRQGYLVVSPGTTLTFGLAFLEGEPLAASISAFLSIMQEEQVLSLSRKPVTVQNLDLCAGSFSSFPKILSNASSTPVITLEFVTPTSFRKNEMQVVFPQPELVFHSLLKRWNAFSESKIPEEHAIEGGGTGLTSAVKKTIQISIAEAKRLGSEKVLPEHILLGLVRASDGIAANRLKNAGIDPETIYVELIRLYTGTRRWHEGQLWKPSD